MSRVKRVPLNYKQKAGNLYDEGFAFEDLDDLSISSCIYEPVLIGLKDKENLESRLDAVFRPDFEKEITVKDSDGKPQTFSIDEIQFLAFVNKPLEIENLQTSNFSDVVKTFSGGEFNMVVPEGQESGVGLFGIRTDPEERYKYIFLTFNNIKYHYQQRRLGEIIVEKRLLSEKVLEKVLRQQSHIRSLRLGTIVAKQANIHPREIDALLEKVGQKEGGNGNLNSGDILVKAGVVSPQIVQQSLAIQKKMRHMKVGALLVDMGYLNEGQVYKVLAEKFRKKYVNIKSVSPGEDVLRQIPQDLIRKLKIFPMYFKKDSLVIATSLPDKAELVEILRKKLDCPFELVVAPHNQIVDGLANLPG